MPGLANRSVVSSSGRCDDILLSETLQDLEAEYSKVSHYRRTNSSSTRDAMPVYGSKRLVTNIREAIELNGDKVDGFTSCVHCNNSVLTVEWPVAERLFI